MSSSSSKQPPRRLSAIDSVQDKIFDIAIYMDIFECVNFLRSTEIQQLKVIKTGLNFLSNQSTSVLQIQFFSIIKYDIPEGNSFKSYSDVIVVLCIVNFR